MENYSLADIGALMGPRDGGGIGGSGAWVLIILFALIFMFGGGGLFGRSGERNATVGDIQRSQDFAALERQNNETVAAVRQSAYDVTGALKDNAYNILGELRDVQAATASGFARQQECCCETLRAIDGVNYNGALNTASINANTTAQVQRILDKLSADREAAQTQRINQLEMQQMFCGVPRISPYGYGIVPQFAPFGCGCNNNI
jgi:hypothetical protein